MHESALVETTASSSQAEHGHEDHVNVPRMALRVFIALCVLTTASLLTYTSFWQEHVPMEVGRAVMLCVSLTKAFLVVVFFMHLWWESKWKYVVTFPAMLVSGLLCVALIPDIGRRTHEYDAARWLNAPEPMPYTVGPDLTVSQPPVGTPSHATTQAAAEHAVNQ